MQASQGLRISIKDCCNFERISGLAFSIFTGDQTFLQWTNKRVIVSIITKLFKDVDFAWIETWKDD